MNIGYACLAVGVPDTGLKSCTLKNAREDLLVRLISHNLKALENIIDYNIRNGILLFRISSDLIPFGSSPVNTLPWAEMFGETLQEIGRKIRDSTMRVSMHPGQYTVLNAADNNVATRAVADLSYHAKVLEALGVGEENKIVLHIGGLYRDKKEAVKRFERNYLALDACIKRRLVIENDDKAYHIRDVLDIGTRLGIPVVFDNLHHAVNPCESRESDVFWVDECKKTWGKKDGTQKIHYSQQAPAKRPGAHSDTIRIDPFMSFYEGLAGRSPDVMLEVKDKNLSAVKCINCISPHKKIKALESEWVMYKYKILENSPAAYFQIEQLLKGKERYPAAAFYRLVEEAIAAESNRENQIGAALQIWDHFKTFATEKEKEGFCHNLKRLKEGGQSPRAVKRVLWKMALKYRDEELLQSCYFSLENGL